MRVFFFHLLIELGLAVDIAPIRLKKNIRKLLGSETLGRILRPAIVDRRDGNLSGLGSFWDLDLTSELIVKFQMVSFLFPFSPETGAFPSPKIS